MTAWDRLTPWRQGHFLSACTVRTLHAVLGTEGDDAVAVVISHDCDLVQGPEVEPFVEVIVGRRILKPDGNFTHGKNPRRLHLRGQAGNNAVWIDLNATNRRMVPKEALADAIPDADLKIEVKERGTLQFWLAARYRRSAFPDEFDRRLAATGTATRLRKILKSEGTHILAVFFDLDEGEEPEKGDEKDTYSLAVDLVYSTAHDPLMAKSSAEGVRKRIEEAFRHCCYDQSTKTWRSIELSSCEPIADEAITYAMSLRLKRWNVDDISFR